MMPACQTPCVLPGASFSAHLLPLPASLQWGFVNFKKVSDATRAYEQLMGEVRHAALGSLLLARLLALRTLPPPAPPAPLLACLPPIPTPTTHPPTKQVVPELTGTRKLKLQFRPVDSRRGSNGRR